MPGHPIPRPVDLTDLPTKPNPMPTQQPMPAADPVTAGYESAHQLLNADDSIAAAAAALALVFADSYEAAADMLRSCTVEQLVRVVESASMLVDLAAAVLGEVDAAPAVPVLGTVGEYASQITVGSAAPTRPFPPMMAGACICGVMSGGVRDPRTGCPMHPVVVVPQGPQIAADTRTLTESTVQGGSAVLALQEDAGGASAAEVPSAD